MWGARIRLALLWVSLAARSIGDWALRIFAWLKLRELGGQDRDAAWHLINAVWVAPWVLLAPFHGSISNVLPKRWVMLLASAFCYGTMLHFLPTEGLWLWCLGLVAFGSALYSSARYAVHPAAAEDACLPLQTVNGLTEMGGRAAIVLGMILGLQVTGELWTGLPAVLALILALNLVSLLAVAPAHFPSDVRRPEPPLRALAGFFRDCRRVFADPGARYSLLGLAIFTGIVTAGSGAIFTLALDNEVAGHNEAVKGMLLVSAGLALGCVLAGLQGNPRRGLGLVPVGITGLVVAQVWGAVAGGLIPPPAPAFLLGLAGGVVIVPLQTAYQAAVPADARGNAMSVMHTTVYLGTAAVAVLMYGLIQVGLLRATTAQLWFLVAVSGGGAVLAWRLLLPQTIEQIIEWVLWPVYRIKSHGPGVRHIPTRGPLLLIANHTSYLDPFWVAKVVPRKLTPMMTSKFYDQPLIRWLMERVVKAIRVQETRFRREVPELDEAINVLQEGGCVLLFPEAILRRSEDRLLRQFGQGVWHILRALPRTPVVVFWVEGGWGSFFSYKGGPPMKKKPPDFWRHIDIAVQEAEVLDPAVLADQRATRAYLMRRCLEARRHLGLDVPEGEAEITEEPAETSEEEKKKG